MNKNQKSEIISLLKKSLSENSFISIVHYRGMNCKQIHDMRVALKKNQCDIKIVKNTLVKLALKNTDLEILTPYFNGPTAIAHSQDIISLSKVLSDISKKDNFLKIVIGYFNKSLISESKIEDIAKLGSLDELRSSFIGVLKYTQSNFTRILSAPSEGLATLKSNS
jgi:large subunit ribosomal protein L10